MASIMHFYELPVYKTCRAFRKKINLLVTQYFPVYEYDLKKQIRNSSRSVSANIAEGFGRYHYQENIQFCRQSRGSLSETMEHAITAYDECIFTKDILKQVNNDYKICLKAINSYIKYLKTAKQKPNNQ